MTRHGVVESAMLVGIVFLSLLGKSACRMMPVEANFSEWVTNGGLTGQRLYTVDTYKEFVGRLLNCAPASRRRQGTIHWNSNSCSFTAAHRHKTSCQLVRRKHAVRRRIHHKHKYPRSEPNTALDNHFVLRSSVCRSKDHDA